MKHIRYRNELIHDGLRYLLAYLVLGAEPFLVLPVLLRVLDKRELGILGAVETFVTVLAGASQLGVKFAYLQHVADVGEKNRGSGFWTSTLLTAVAGFILGSIGSLAMGSAIVRMFFNAEIEIHWGVLGFLLFTMNTQMMLVTDLRARRSPIPFVVATISRMSCYVLSIPVFARIMPNHVEGVILSQGFSCMAGIVIIFLTGGIPFKFSIERSLAKEFLSYGLPIAGGGLLKYGTDALLPWFCLRYAASSAAAMTLASKTSSIFDALFGLPFLMAWGGRVYHMVKEEGREDLARRMFFEVTSAAGISALISFAVGYSVLMLSVKDASVLSESVTLLPLALVGKALFVLRSPASVGQVAARNMRWHLKYAILGLLLAVFLVPSVLKILGALYGWSIYVLIEFFTVTSVYLESKKMLKELDRCVLSPQNRNA